uniref:MARVEL domain-containing protein n=1 Tax=Ascaris lumbricoides TaxID=6252 RepID=A0A0M3I7N5_ASCLU
MGSEYVRSIHGIITAAQVILGFVAMFASSFIWDHTNVYIQLGYKGYGWQTLILAILLLTFLIAIAILASQVAGQDLLAKIGKFKFQLLILYAGCLILLIIAASLESWYCSLSIGNSLYHARFIIVTVSHSFISVLLSKFFKVFSI